jgi:hypothetical protein
MVKEGQYLPDVQQQQKHRIKPFRTIASNLLFFLSNDMFDCLYECLRTIDFSDKFKNSKNIRTKAQKILYSKTLHRV